MPRGSTQAPVGMILAMNDKRWNYDIHRYKESFLGYINKRIHKEEFSRRDTHREGSLHKRQIISFI